jgi:pilus assembly protein TadC
MMLFVFFLAIAAGAALFFLLRKPQADVLERIAALDKSSGVANENATLLGRVMDERRSGALTERIQEAGWQNVTPMGMLRRSIQGLLVGIGIGVAFMVLLHGFSWGVLVGALALAGFGAYRPFGELDKAIKKRKSAIRRVLPDFLDVLSTTVEAGVALNLALAACSGQISGPLHDELENALADIRLGRSRIDALLAMAQRIRLTDLTTVIVAIVQAERLGSSVSEILLGLAIDYREKRYARAEEVAATLGNKLVIPVGLCMMPALLIMIFGGVAARVLENR